MELLATRLREGAWPSNGRAAGCGSREKGALQTAGLRWPTLAPDRLSSGFSPDRDGATGGDHLAVAVLSPGSRRRRCRRGSTAEGRAGGEGLRLLLLLALERQPTRDGDGGRRRGAGTGRGRRSRCDRAAVAAGAGVRQSGRNRCGHRFISFDVVCGAVLVTSIGIDRWPGAVVGFATGRCRRASGARLFEWATFGKWANSSKTPIEGRCAQGWFLFVMPAASSYEWIT
jgi:hypothetical protein